MSNVNVESAVATSEMWSPPRQMRNNFVTMITPGAGYTADYIKAELCAKYPPQEAPLFLLNLPDDPADSFPLVILGWNKSPENHNWFYIGRKDPVGPFYYYYWYNVTTGESHKQQSKSFDSLELDKRECFEHCTPFRGEALRIMDEVLWLTERYLHADPAMQYQQWNDFSIEINSNRSNVLENILGEWLTWNNLKVTHGNGLLKRVPQNKARETCQFIVGGDELVVTEKMKLNYVTPPGYRYAAVTDGHTTLVFTGYTNETWYNQLYILNVHSTEGCYFNKRATAIGRCLGQGLVPTRVTEDTKTRLLTRIARDKYESDPWMDSIKLA